MIRSGAWRWARRAVLWLGLSLCVYAVWRARAYTGQAIQRVGLATWLAVAVMLVATWGLAVMAWRRYLLAYTAQLQGWRASMRQLGLLLVGKYVPGGVFGFLARLYDEPAAPRERLFWAGLAEQSVGLAMAIAMGGVLYLAAQRQATAWLLLVLALPAVAVPGLRLLQRSAGSLPWLRQYSPGAVLPDRRQLLLATTLQLSQLLAWAGLILVLVHSLFGLHGHAALGIAGAFCLAVAAGMLAVFAPGGIGVREATLVVLVSPWLDTKQAIFLSALLRLLGTLLDMFAGALAALLVRQGRDWHHFDQLAGKGRAGVVSKQSGNPDD